MDQSTRERKIQDLVAHRSPEDLAGMVVDAQAAKDSERDAQDRDKAHQQDAAQQQKTQQGQRLNQPTVAADADEPEPTDKASRKHK